MVTVSLSDMLPHAIETYTETMGRFPAALAAVSLCAAGMAIALLLERCVPDEAELAARHAKGGREGARRAGRGGWGGGGGGGLGPTGRRAPPGGGGGPRPGQAGQPARAAHTGQAMRAG